MGLDFYYSLSSPSSALVPSIGNAPKLGQSPLNGVKKTHFFGTYDPSLLCKQGLIKMTHNSRVMVPLSSTKSSGPDETDDRAVETVHKLHAAIQNRSIKDLSDIIGEECRCVSNFISMFQPFHGKTQTLKFFSTLMEMLGNNFEFIIQPPTLHGGTGVGVQWAIAWNKTHLVPLGKGFSFYHCHYYKGSMVIRNVEIFLEPLLHIEPLRLKVMGVVMAAMDKMSSFKTKDKSFLQILLVIFIASALFCLIKLCLI
ncbi:hypothetical protein RJ641_018581 [Dillenia turbinata]|uniref:SnoaL-like domain-containing protein n=1 Tax=Dillenia turbinata TaxID=194707 RepID=A0AAN8ULM8_9MAGN